jgi:hypothetical protein
VGLVIAVFCQAMCVESLSHHSCVLIVDNLDTRSKIALASLLMQLFLLKRLVIFFIFFTIIKIHAKFSNIVTRITEVFFFFEVTSESINQLFHTELHCLHLTLNVSDVWVICNISSIA